MSNSAGFTAYAGEQLLCERVNVSALAKRYGTPLYLYSKNDIAGRFKVLTQAFGRIPHTICFSVKANSNLAILSLLAKLGAGFDVVSGGELSRVLIARKSAAKKTVFSGVGKTAAEIELAIKSNIALFNIESEQEFELLDELASKRRKVVRVGFRVNPDVSAATHPYISTGLHEHKFGVPIANAKSLYARAARSKYLRAEAVSVHIGSQITDFSAFSETMTRVAALVRELRWQGSPISVIDAGGGLGIDYSQDEDLHAFKERVHAYAEAILAPIADVKVHLMLEPGRSMVARAGMLVTKVIYTKQNDNKRFAIVDAAMNDLIRPALYKAQHRVIPVYSTMARTFQYDVVGPICESSDFLAQERALPELASDDLLAILDTGAYGMTLASNYNSRPRAAELLVDGKNVKLIRKRETMADLLRAER